MIPLSEEKDWINYLLRWGVKDLNNKEEVDTVLKQIKLDTARRIREAGF